MSDLHRMATIRRAASASPLPLIASHPPAPPTTPRLRLRSSPSMSISSLSPSDRRLLRGGTVLRTPQSPRSPRCAEVAGGAAAGCAAVCCCCPCGLVNLVFLAVVRLPAGLCQKAIRRRRMLRKRSARAALLRSTASGGEDGGRVLGTMGLAGAAAVLVAGGRAAAVASAEVVPSEEMIEMEEEMWDLFYATGFWRSPSQREY